MSGRTPPGPSSDAFRIEFWQPGDRVTAARLLEAATEVDGRPNLGVDWFEWKMGASPWGPATVAYALDAATGDIAGVIAFGAWRFWHGGSIVNAALSYETFVSHRYQRRGLFSKLTTAAIEALRARNVALIVNFPNARSLPGFLKLGFEDLGGFQTWVRPRGLVRTTRFAYRMLRGRRTPVVPLASSTTVPDDWIAAAGELAEERRTFPVPWASSRDADILRWRYATIPTYTYATSRARDVALLGRHEELAGMRTCRLLESLSTWRPSRRAVADALDELQAASRADVMVAQVTAVHPLRRWLPTLGFLPAPDHVSVCARDLTGGGPLPRGNRWVMGSGDFHTT